MDNFYQKCGDILGVPAEGTPFPYERRTRWNCRNPGQGRYPGIGIIRRYGNTFHIAFRSPRVHTVILGEQAVYNFLKRLKKTI